MWWLTAATAVLVLLTVTTYRLRRSVLGLDLTPASERTLMALLGSQAETVGVGFRELDERARELGRRVIAP